MLFRAWYEVWSFISIPNHPRHPLSHIIKDCGLLDSMGKSHNAGYETNMYIYLCAHALHGYFFHRVFTEYHNQTIECLAFFLVFFSSSRCILDKKKNRANCIRELHFGFHGIYNSNKKYSWSFIFSPFTTTLSLHRLLCSFRYLLSLASAFP